MNTTREEIIAANPLLDYCQAQGWQLKKRRSSLEMPVSAPRRDNT